MPQALELYRYLQAVPCYHRSRSGPPLEHQALVLIHRPSLIFAHKHAPTQARSGFYLATEEAPASTVVRVLKHLSPGLCERQLVCKFLVVCSILFPRSGEQRQGTCGCRLTCKPLSRGVHPSNMWRTAQHLDGTFRRA